MEASRGARPTIGVTEGAGVGGEGGRGVSRVRRVAESGAREGGGRREGGEGRLVGRAVGGAVRRTRGGAKASIL